jgi:hypothetical protein
MEIDELVRMALALVMLLAMLIYVINNKLRARRQGGADLARARYDRSPGDKRRLRR